MVGGYKLDRLIGEGGMGVVFEATHAALETRVAIKLLHPHLTRDENTATRFEREARAAAKIRHPNVVRILDFVKAEDGAACIVMDLLMGESLTERLRRAPLPPDEASEMLLPIMDAIGHMHDKGIVHRDLKPDNIYLSREAGRIVPKLLDFGIAKVIDDSSHVTRTGMVVGTPAYMSPEQARGSKEIGPGVDIWAMGIVWFECIAGRTPFDADGPQAMLAEILTKQPPPLRSIAAHVSVPVATVIDTALARRPVERFQKMEAFATALKEAFATPAPSKPPPPKQQQPLPGSPLSATGPIGSPFPETRATPQAMSAEVGTSPTLLADPNDPTQPSGQQPIPQPVPQQANATAASPAPQQSKLPLVIGALVLLGLGGVAVAVVANGDEDTTVPVTEETPRRVTPVVMDRDNRPELDAATDVAVDVNEDEDAGSVDAGPEHASDETDAAEETTSMMRGPRMTAMMEAAMMEAASAEMETEPELPEQVSDRALDQILRIRSMVIRNSCDVHQRGLPQRVPTAEVTFTINPEGRALHGAIQFARGTPFSIQNCLRTQLSIIRFPQAQNPTTFTRNIPVSRN